MFYFWYDKNGFRASTRSIISSFAAFSLISSAIWKFLFNGDFHFGEKPEITWSLTWILGKLTDLGDVVFCQNTLQKGWWIWWWHSIQVDSMTFHCWLSKPMGWVHLLTYKNVPFSLLCSLCTNNLGKGLNPFLLSFQSLPDMS